MAVYKERISRFNKNLQFKLMVKKRLIRAFCPQFTYPAIHDSWYSGLANCQ